jgi:hypothetical protein
MFLLVFFSFFPFLVLAFFDSSLLRSHFWPFTEVVRKIGRQVTRKVWKSSEEPRITRIGEDGLPAEMPLRFHSEPPIRLRSRLRHLRRGKQGKRSALRMLFRREGGDDFFEARLAAQGIPERH